MNNLKALILISVLVFTIGCGQDYYEVPTNANGEPDITDISKATSDGITVLDNQFTINATLPNAKEGDAIKAEVLKSQVPPQGGEKQLLPLEGTQKDLTVSSDLKVSVTYTREEAKLNNVDDFVRVTFGGETASAQLRIDMEKAITASDPEFDGNSVAVTRSAGTAYFDVNVQPKDGDYTGTITVKGKNGINGSWMDIGQGTYNVPAKVPISNADFAASDTVHYLFIAQRNAYADSVTKEVVISDPTFFFEKSGSLFLNSEQSGMDLIEGASVAANDPNAILSISSNNDGSLEVKGGPNWETAGKSIKFVSSTDAMYDKNNSKDAVEAYNNGSAVSQINPNNGTGVYIFKLVNGADTSDIYYGMIKVSTIKPGESIDFDYRIGNRYAHLSEIK